MCWLPGMDHARIATQAKDEQRLRGEGVSRYDLGREKFVNKSGTGRIVNTIKQQWGKMEHMMTVNVFTLNEGLNWAVNKSLLTLQWAIYRGEYIISWDPQARTALWMKLFIKMMKAHSIVSTIHWWDNIWWQGISATTRQTMFGDVCGCSPKVMSVIRFNWEDSYGPTWSAVNSSIADEYVEKNFGTAWVKSRPAHDPNDFQVGEPPWSGTDQHDDRDGRLADELAGPYNGMERSVRLWQILKLATTY